MPHIPGHPAEDDNNNETGGLPYLMPDEVEEDSKIQSPENIAEPSESMVAPGSGNATQFAQEIADLFGMELEDPNKPLGKGFQKVYEVPQYDDSGQVKTDPDSGDPLVKNIPAEEFLTSDLYQKERREMFGTGEAFEYVYYQRDVLKQFNALPPAMRIATKNLLSSAGLINLDKTYGTYADAETLKGLKLAMEFSMNNGGKMSWMSASKSLNDYAQSQKAYMTGSYEFTEEDLTDFVDDMLAGAETRKGSPLSSSEKQIIMNKLGVSAEEYASSLGDLQPEQQERLDYNPLTGETMFVPEVEAEEPDPEILTEAGEDVLDEIFAPREALAEKSEEEDDTFTRMQRNLRGLTVAEGG
tara:strand:+ start:8322 stop:9389 length:1068 start_codon:yes stop_codon:yes gene_type:complete